MFTSASNKTNNRFDLVIVSLKCKKLSESEDPSGKLEVKRMDGNDKDNGYCAKRLYINIVDSCLLTTLVYRHCEQ